MTKHGLAVVGITFAAAVQSFAQDASFKLSPGKFSPPAGKAFLLKSVMPPEKGIVEMEVAGQKVEGSVQMGTRVEWAIKALEEGQLAIRVKEFGGEAIVEVGGERTVETETNVLEGVDLMAERGSEGWEVTPYRDKKKPLDKDQQEQLDYLRMYLDALDHEAAVTGTKEYSVGDTIKLDQSLFGGLGMIEDDLKGNAELKITGIEEYEGLRCAVLEGRFFESGTMDSGEPELSGRNRHRRGQSESLALVRARLRRPQRVQRHHGAEHEHARRRYDNEDGRPG